MKHQKVIFTGGVFVGVLVALSMSASADRLSQFNQLAEEKGAKWGVNPNMIRAIVSVESAGRIDAVSPAGARGLMQLMPATAERMGVPRNQLFDPERNMEAGVRYLSYLNKMFDGNPRLVAAAYNAGEGAVKKYGGVPPYRETQNYAPAVVSRLNLLENCGVAGYTKQHMANPNRYAFGASVASPNPHTPSQARINAWLGKNQAVTGMAYTPPEVIKAKPAAPVTTLDTNNRSVATVEVVKANKPKRHIQSFVNTDLGDGNFVPLTPIQ